MKKSYVAIAGALLAQLLLAAYLYPSLPDSIVTHWDAAGAPNGYMPKLFGLSIIPAITAVLILMFAAIPRIDPLGANVRKFRRQYGWFVAVLALFMLALQAEVVLWNIGVFVSPNVVLSVGMAALFFYAGVLFESAKRNWFVGIRTPWTMSSERVWDRTHKLAGKLFKAAGVLAAAGALLPEYAVLLVLAPVMIVAIYSVAYSYVEYKKGRRRSASRFISTCVKRRS